MSDVESSRLVETLGVNFSDILKLEEHPHIGVVNFIRQKIAPLHLKVSTKARIRVNILISIVNFKYLFGGYLGVFNLARILGKEGYNVRLVIVDECIFEPEAWKREIKRYEDIDDLFDIVETFYAFDRAEALEISENDVFVATSWWTAHIANYAIKFLNSKKILYMIQEYEPIFYPMGAFAALAMESYNFPHYAIISTGILKEYFSRNKLGVFKDGQHIGEQSAVSFENAILKFKIDKLCMKNRKTKRFVFYARPEEHNVRNLFELGIIALSNIIKGGHLDTSSWEFYGIGTHDGNKKITLDDNVFMSLLPKVSLDEYKNLLPEFDMGLSLMLSPHPSIVPLEMAAAGMFAVTNTFANKTAEVLRAISTNIIPSEPTIEGIERSLITALENIDDYDSRVKGANVTWSQNWGDTFNGQFMEKINRFICKSTKKPCCPRTDSVEKMLVKDYIQAVAKDPTTFVDSISPDDEMYTFIINETNRKEMASYLYFKSGRESLQSIENIVRSSGKSFAGIRSFLDFASGYGRVTRFLIQEIEAGKIWVSDIYHGAVDFQKKYFKVNGFYSETAPSKMKFPGNFEVIYVGSLFFHLPANRFKDWLSALYDILEDDGILIFSTHGEQLCPPEIPIDSSGFTFFAASESKTLPVKEYGSTFVSRNWVERLAKELEIFKVYFLEKGLCGFQDIYVVTKKYISSLSNPAPTNFFQGDICSVQITKDGSVYITGWAIDKEFGAPVEEVNIYVGDELSGKATLGIPSQDIENHFKKPDCLNSGWEHIVERSALKNKLTLKNTSFILIKGLIKDHRGDVGYLNPFVFESKDNGE